MKNSILRKNISLSEGLSDLLYQDGNVVRDGSYVLNRSHFIKAVDHFVKTGENKLPELDILIHNTWEDYTVDNCYEYHIGEEKLPIFKRFLNNQSFWKLDDLTKDQVVTIKDNYEFSLKLIDTLKSYTFRRKESLRNNAKIRFEVLDKFNNECSKCGSSSNLSIDHIIPVKKGGGDEMENLQILCRSCNSSKGGK